MVSKTYELITADKSSFRVSLKWLRDNCRCPSCYNTVASERRLTVLDLPEELKIDSYEFLKNELVVIC